MHTVDVFVNTEYQDMSLVGIDLRSGQNQETVLLAQPGYVFVVPEPVVFGKADTVNPVLLCLLNKLDRVEKAVVGPGSGVGMEAPPHLPFP